MKESNLTAVGDCFYCQRTVWAAPGQALKWKNVRKMTPQGEVLEEKEYPTHKKCRKNA
jgi:hypothetical protein